MPLSLALSLPGACPGFTPTQDGPSFPACLRGDGAHEAPPCSSFCCSSQLVSFPSCSARGWFPLGQLYQMSSKAGLPLPAGTNPFLCSLAGLGRAAARLLVSSKGALATKELCVCDHRVLAGARLAKAVSRSWYSLSLPLRPGAWGALRPGRRPSPGKIKSASASPA